eukprot:1458079-Rhodomonas_salina.1
MSVSATQILARESADRAQSRADAFAATDEVRELGGPGENEIVHSTVEELPYKARHLLQEPFPASWRV